MQHKLSTEARALLISFIVYAVMLPLITTFTNAFIWHGRSDLSGLLLFYLPSYILICLTFIFNGWILKKVAIKYLFAIGLISVALGSAILVYWGRTDDIALMILGSVWGITIGLYWSNRNILTQKNTNDENRNYFTGIESSSQTIIAMVVPVVMGYFIEAVGRNTGFDYASTYKILVWIVLAGSVLGALYILKADFSDYTPKKLILRNSSKAWNKIRLINFLLGITSGVLMIFPSFLILTLVGKEATLGIMDTLTAIAGALIIYFAGRKITAQKRQRILYMGLFAEILGMFVFYFFWGPLGAGIYVLVTSIRAKLIWLGTNPLVMKYIDRDAVDNEIYQYNFDREVFLNAGRILAILCMFLLNGSNVVVSITPVLLIVAVTGIIYVENRLRNGNSSSK